MNASPPSKPLPIIEDQATRRASLALLPGLVGYRVVTAPHGWADFRVATTLHPC